jgi:hypothetical protein
VIADILSNSYYRLDGHTEKGRAVSKTRAAYDQLRRPVCQPMAMGRMVLHDDAKAAQFEWKFLEIFGFGP